MSRIEKISFITSFWTLVNVYGKIELYSDGQLDLIISNIILKVKREHQFNALDQVRSMPIFIN